MSLVAGALEQQVAVALGQFAPGDVGVDPVRLRNRFEQPPVVERGRLRPRLQGPFGDRQRRVGDDQLGVDHPLEAEAVAALTAAVGRVEGEDPRLELGHRGAAVQAGELLAEDQHLAPLAGARAGQNLRSGALGRARVTGIAIETFDLDDPLGELGCRLERLGEPLAQTLLHHQPVDDDRDVVLELLVELDAAVLVEPAELAVDDGARVALRPHLLEQLAVLPLAPTDDRRQDHEPGPLGEGHYVVGDLLDRLAGDRLAAVVTVGPADPRPEQPQIVVDLGHRADGRARVARGRLLVDRDRRREPFDRIDVGLLHLAQELACVGGERLDVAALALGIDRVEGEARLTRAREPRHHHQRLARQDDVDALEVVGARARDDYLAGAGDRPFSLRGRTAVPVRYLAARARTSSTIAATSSSE